MAKLNTVAEIAESYKYLGLKESDITSIAFRVVDLMLNNVTQEAIDCGAYYMPSYVGDEKLEKAFSEILWALYEQHFENEKPAVAGPWVHIGIDGLHISEERFPSFDVVQTSMGGAPRYHKKEENND